ncbi:MAG: Uncharacterised protein [Synechococcus sp. MIT S9220]|nr:MAG: Uncharacterised protein [Synechococcus sp. MIT S9220]
MQWCQECGRIGAIQAAVPMATVPAIKANTTALGEVIFENGPGDQRFVV